MIRLLRKYRQIYQEFKDVVENVPYQSSFYEYSGDVTEQGQIGAVAVEFSCQTEIYKSWSKTTEFLCRIWAKRILSNLHNATLQQTHVKYIDDFQWAGRFSDFPRVKFLFIFHFQKAAK